MNNDLISRSALLDDIQADVDYGGVGGMVGGALKRYVKRAPAVDAVIPVRCAQCEHFKRNLENDTYCSSVNGLTDPQEDDFCSYGERTEVLTMPVDEYMKAACWIVCPMCDEPKCVGRFNCPEIKAWIEKKRRADDCNEADN